jgi:hypothetical protein
MKEVLVLLLGWLLGLLSPQIVETIGRRYRRPELMRSISLELDELRFKMVTIRCNVRQHFGNLDREVVTWAAARAEKYQGVLAKQGARKTILDYVKASDKDLAIENAAARDPRRTPSFRKHSLPFLSSQLHAIGILPVSVQRALTEVLARLDYYNSATERLAANLALTFDAGLTPENWQVIQNNNREILESVEKIMIDIVEQIDAIAPAVMR